MGFSSPFASSLHLQPGTYPGVIGSIRSEGHFALNNVTVLQVGDRDTQEANSCSQCRCSVGGYARSTYHFMITLWWRGICDLHLEMECARVRSDSKDCETFALRHGFHYEIWHYVTCY